jgi:hypothetical protein
MNPPDPSLELKPLVAPEPLLPQQTFPEWAWYAMAVGVIVLTVLIIVIARTARRRTEKATPQNIRLLAYQEALAALGTATQERIQDVAVTVSSALRRYLARVSGDPALYETHEEFVARHEVLTRYPEDLRAAASAMFTELARLKYGREATGDPGALVEKARTLLENLHSIPAA